MELKVHQQTNLEVYVSVAELEEILNGLRFQQKRNQAIRDNRIIRVENTQYRNTLTSGDHTLTFHLSEPTNYQCVIQGGKEVFLPT